MKRDVTEYTIKERDNDVAEKDKKGQLKRQLQKNTKKEKGK